MSEPPVELTTTEERNTWRNLERCLQTHCGNDSKLFREREESFIKVMEIMCQRIRTHQAENVA